LWSDLSLGAIAFLVDVSKPVNLKNQLPGIEFGKFMMMKNMSNQHLSILLLGTQMEIGGAQKVLLDQANWFHQRGHKVFAVFFYDKEGLQSRWQAVSDFPVIDLKALQKGKRRINAILLVRGLFSLWRLLHREKFDVIETFTHDSNMLALPIAWLARVPVRIATHHGVIAGFPRWRERLHAWMVNHNIAHILVTVSKKTREIAIVEGVKAGRISVIQNGIAPMTFADVNRSEVRKEVGIGMDDFFLLSVGRLVYEKAHEILISAMPAVLKEFPNAKAGICGDGVLRTNLETQIKSLGLGSSVKLLGRQINIAKFLSSADVFILPSRSEGLPIALLEAMSVGLPVVVTKGASVDEVVVEGVHGLIVPVDNAWALAQGILQLLHDSPIRVRMGAASKKRVNEVYSIDRMGEQYLALMLKLLGSKLSRS
jgi:glycosyltransferase involved in cell wall biosynthesis